MRSPVQKMFILTLAKVSLPRKALSALQHTHGCFLFPCIVNPFFNAVEQDCSVETEIPCVVPENMTTRDPTEEDENVEPSRKKRKTSATKYSTPHAVPRCEEVPKTPPPTRFVAIPDAPRRPERSLRVSTVPFDAYSLRISSNSLL